MNESIQETFIEVHWTSGSLDEARRVARYLAQQRLVACAQIIPWIESIYLWNNELETSQESKVVFKTRLENYETIRKIIEENCRYEVPQITWIFIDGGNEQYMRWLAESVSGSLLLE